MKAGSLYCEISVPAGAEHRREEVMQAALNAIAIVGAFARANAWTHLMKERFFDRIGARIDRLAAHPRLGPRRSDIHPSVRLLVEGAYLILFETHPDTDDGPVEWVEIVRVVDGRRNLTALL